MSEMKSHNIVPASFVRSLLKERACNPSFYSSNNSYNDDKRSNYDAQDMFRQRILGLPIEDLQKKSSFENVEDNIPMQRTLTAEQMRNQERLKFFQAKRLIEIEDERIMKEKRLLEEASKHKEEKVRNQHKKQEKQLKLIQKQKKEDEHTKKKMAAFLLTRKLNKLNANLNSEGCTSADHDCPIAYMNQQCKAVLFPPTIEVVSSNCIESSIVLTSEQHCQPLDRKTNENEMQNTYSKYFFSDPPLYRTNKV